MCLAALLVVRIDLSARRNVQCIAHVRELVQLRFLEREESFSAADQLIQRLSKRRADEAPQALGRSQTATAAADEVALVAQMVAHFQKLFAVKSTEGVFPRMNVRAMDSPIVSLCLSSH